MKHDAVFRFFVVRTLHAITARAMGVPFRPGKPALEAYAAFTRDQASKIAESDLPAVEERMYKAARRTGSLLRNLLFIRTDAGALRMVIRLYKCIGIELEEPSPGAILVRSCYFSRFYTPEICRVMSAMDKGIFAGLFGGGELTFQNRITEGCPCCKATFFTGETRIQK